MVRARILRAIWTFPTLEALAKTTNAVTLHYSIHSAAVGACTDIAFSPGPTSKTVARALLADAILWALDHRTCIQFAPLSEEAFFTCTLATLTGAASRAVEFAYILAAIFAPKTWGAGTLAADTLALLQLFEAVVWASVVAAIRTLPTLLALAQSINTATAVVTEVKSTASIVRAIVSMPARITFAFSVDTLSVTTAEITLRSSGAEVHRTVLAEPAVLSEAAAGALDTVSMFLAAR